MRKPAHKRVKIRRVTKADKRAKSKAMPVMHDGLTTSFSAWQSTGYESARKAQSRYHSTR